MGRPCRILLLGCIAVSFLYLLLHASEPFRLNIGDPWSEANVLTSIKYVKQYGFIETSFTDILDIGPLTADSYRYIHYPPLAEITYGAIAKYLGVTKVGTFRLFAIALSGLAMWLLFQYVRRLYNDTVGLIATALWSTSLFWLMYADSIHQTPVLQASAFLALWGLIRVLETKQRRHYAAAFFGSLACFLTSYDYWLFLPVAVLMTIYLKAGNPFTGGRIRWVLLCAAGCFSGLLLKALIVIWAVGWSEFVADLHFQFLERATSTFEALHISATSALVRRITLVFTPLFWIAAGYHLIKMVRAPSIAAALKDNVGWLLLTGLLFLRVFWQLAASQMMSCEVLLPFYAIGSALILERLLTGRWLARAVAIGSIVFAAGWGLYFMATHKRSFLDPDDMDRVNARLVAHDRNDYMLSNLMADGPIQAFLERHYWPVPDAEYVAQTHIVMLTAFERTGSETVHALVFTTPESRFIDKSLWPLALGRRLWSVIGWPHVWRNKTNRVIAEYDAKLAENLEAMGATHLFAGSNFSLYRIDRSVVIAKAEARVPVARVIDFGSFSSEKHKLLGWSGQQWVKASGAVVSRPIGRSACPETAGASAKNACPTVLMKRGLDIKRFRQDPTAQFMIRVERSCDLRLRIQTVGKGALRVELNGVERVEVVDSTMMSVDVPGSAVRSGINVVTIEDLTGSLPIHKRSNIGISTVEIEPHCQ